ncbi:chemotaxis protein CheW [Serpentinicella sp. ANB-PHB4]|uniref:chemotaxis protein CheW n=1 Tax=Serpentinicella sp. ANB-PHB4 TaxID=3074076 RepID=UPI00285C6D07|nr:chemotaxis protein CheW [Serpentinicella sp. ANB-PHB4]MDR5658485.1 chemotaxis protein CheW [Serpentinicella sp. ANB-PHB4]
MSIAEQEVVLPTSENVKLTEMILVFALGEEEFGIDISHVIEIIGIQEITSIPELPTYIKGVINLRGKIIPVMDVRLKFKKAFKAYHDRTCIIVIKIQDIFIGLAVDSVSEVITIKTEDITPPPQINNQYKNKYIRGIVKTSKKIKLLLDVEQLIKKEEIEGVLQD